MQHFSKEYLDRLIAEHKLVSTSVTQLQVVGYAGYAQRHGVDTVGAAIANLKVKKVELEGQIDALSEYLNG